MRGIRLIFAVSAIGVCVTLTSGLIAGEFGKGRFASHEMKVTIRVPRPPDVLLGKKSLRVLLETTAAEAKNSPALQLGERIRSLSEQQLSADFTIAAQNPESTVMMRVAAYSEPQIQIFTVKEKRRFKIGEREVVDKGNRAKGIGWVQKEDVFEERTVPVQYWQGNTSVKLDIQVRDAANRVIDTWSPAAAFSEKKETAVDGVSQMIGKTLPTKDEILTGIVNQVLDAINNRYLKIKRNETFLLAVDEELRGGNARAAAGDWKGALAIWESAHLKKKQNEGDRLFNLAAGYEALGYEAYLTSDKPDESQTLLTKASETYVEALKLDPRERNIVEGKARLDTTMASMDQAFKRYAEERERMRLAQQEEDRRKAEEQKLAEDTARAVATVRDDTPEESNFRKIVQIELSKMPDKLGPPERAKLEGMGPAYKLGVVETRRVVIQEINRRDEHRANLDKYKAMFSTLAEDKKITRDEREQLRLVVTNLSLSPDEVKSIESQFKFVEEAPRAPAATTTATKKTASRKPPPIVPTQEKSLKKETAK